MISSWIASGWSASSSSSCALLITCGVVLQHLGDLLLARPAAGRCCASAMSVNAIESVASMIAPAKASPNDSPNEPAAELTPAASLTRSSEIGASV